VRTVPAVPDLGTVQPAPGSGTPGEVRPGQLPVGGQTLK